MGKAKLHKALRKCVKDLPPVMQEATEVHVYTGAQLLATNEDKDLSGNPVDPKLAYKYRMPVKLAVNHARRLREAIKQGVSIKQYRDAAMQAAAQQSHQ